MIDERQHDGSDALVTDVYRELAGERTPENLDDAVLRMAAKERRTRYSLVRGWMRPAAWAVTIGLSLAIVLELTRYSGTEPATEPATEARIPSAAGSAPEPLPPAGARPSAGQADAFLPQSADIVEQAEEIARFRSGEDRAFELGEDSAANGGCPAQAREAAGTWFECIEELRRKGLDGIAEEEHAAFERAFPDYEPPTTDR